MARNPKLDPVYAWFDARGWAPFNFQTELWERYLAGESGLLHAPTGFGKTLAAWMGPLAEGLGDPRARAHSKKRDDAPPLTVMWLTPMRALAQDLTLNLAQVARDIAPGWVVESRTGDTPTSVRTKQKKQMPTALVTTPESLSLMLSYEEAAETFASLKCVVVDEWHELLGTKRGTQTELGLARLRTIAPHVRIWGLSATLGNLDDALTTLMGTERRGVRVSGTQKREVEFKVLVPDDVGRFPWAGHLGLHLAEDVASQLEEAASSLVFVNTRGQAERWYQALVFCRPDMEDRIGLHHGSLDREERERVERGIADGSLWAAVSTSSLDLGVDFAPVDQVLQIGSPKGLARLAQRAGRSGHGPGRTSRIVGVPTHALEIVEFVATKRALAEGIVEPRRPLERPLDVLAQHVVTAAFGGGFEEEALLREVRTTGAYQDLSDEEWRWVMDFCRFGGDALKAYERYARIRPVNGTYRGGSPIIGRDHRASIGTIASAGALPVVMKNGRNLGTVEEMFLARLGTGDAFTFAGRLLELVRLEADKAVVKQATGRKGAVVSWSGGRMPLSNELAMCIRRILRECRDAEVIDDPELAPIAELLEIQRTSSRLPGEDELLIERAKSREGHHVFFYPIAGRLVHEGLATLLAYRVTRATKATIATVCNDWGFGLMSRKELPVADEEWKSYFSAEGLLEDVLASVDAAGLARRHFREVARIAGLVSSGPPGGRKNRKQLQTSSGLIYDVLVDFDPGNLLLSQSKREVLERTLEFGRLRMTIDELSERAFVVSRLDRLTPFSFPLWVDRLREEVTSETWEDRVQSMLERLEKDAKPSRKR